MRHAFPNGFPGTSSKRQVGINELVMPRLVGSDPGRQRARLNVVDHSVTLLIEGEGPVIPYVAICDLPKFITARARNCEGISDRRLSSRLHHMSGHSSRLVVRETTNRMFTIWVQHVSINHNLKSQQLPCANQPLPDGSLRITGV
jgi:hypothetical protein